MLRPSESGSYVIRALGIQPAHEKDNFCGIIREISILGTDEKPLWKREADGLFLISKYRDGDYPIVFKMEID